MRTTPGVRPAGPRPDSIDLGAEVSIKKARLVYATSRVGQPAEYSAIERYAMSVMATGNQTTDD